MFNIKQLEAISNVCSGRWCVCVGGELAIRRCGWGHGEGEGEIGPGWIVRVCMRSTTDHEHFIITMKCALQYCPLRHIVLVFIV